MTTDEVKEYLVQVHKLYEKLQREKDKLADIRSAVEYRSPAFGGSGGHSGGDKVGVAVTNIMEREQRVDDLSAAYTEKYNEVEQIIDRLDNDTLEELMELRYLRFFKWEKIAEDLGYTVRRVLQLHGRALQKISLDFT